MKLPVSIAASVSAFFLLAGLAPAAALTGFPFTDEDLNYSINWPSGLSLGESHLHARHSGSNWNFELDIDAGIPGYQVKDVYRAQSTGSFCSLSFDRNTSHGNRKAQEKETIDGPEATRSSLNGGGVSRVPVPDCVKDALTLLYFARHELGQGRVPNPQQMLFGGLYQVKLDYAGAQTIQVGDQSAESDKVICTVAGAATSFKFEMYFARDPARTPLLIKAPLAMGMFAMELVR
ncbi:MAG TPA: DUF3108 domain-containing protein [Bryobacteraceae bacterium]|jgi:hypothetical protein|nr:DUF3108 domain-containing protein [Bryobacteraceae bacterium]